MAARKPFTAGMSSSDKVKNMTKVDTLLKNDIDTGYNLQYIPIEDIEPNKLNNEVAKEDVQLIQYSIEINGLAHALVIIKNTDEEKEKYGYTKKYRLLSGEQRYRALSGMTPEERKKQFPLGIPCKVEKKHFADEVEERIFIRGANLDARNYTPEEWSKLIRLQLKDFQLMQEKGTIKSAIKEIVEKYNINERMVRRYAAANRMIPELQEVLDEGKINLKEAEKFAAFSEDAQKQILELINSTGKVEKVDLEAIRKIEEENEVLEQKALEAAKELEEKDKRLKALEGQIKALEELSKAPQEDKDTSSEENNTYSTSEPKKADSESDDETLSWYKEQYEKEQKERKRFQSNFERLQQEAKENRNRNINTSKEELKRINDFAKAQNIQEEMFRQIKELEKVKDSIKNDDTLKIQFEVVATRLHKLFE